jgi:uncharacterized protein YbdZ (MbtH family)
VSRIIDGNSHQAIKLMKKPAPTLSVFWVYVSRTNNDNVSWPSIRGLAKDTGWGTTAVAGARQWLIDHQALEEVKDYIRPQWRELEPKELTRLRNLDQARYFRPTGYIVVNGNRHDLLYVPRDQESNQPYEPEGSHVTPAVTSDDVAHRKSCDITPSVAELDSSKDKLSSIKDSATPNGGQLGIGKPKRERKPRPRDPIFDIVADRGFDFPPGTKDIPASGRIAKIATYCKGKDVKPYKNCTVDEIVHGAEPPVASDELMDFYADKGEYASKDITKFAEQFQSWRINRVKRPTPVTVIPAQTEDVFGDAGDFLPLENGMYTGVASA